MTDPVYLKTPSTTDNSVTLVGDTNNVNTEQTLGDVMEQQTGGDEATTLTTATSVTYEFSYYQNDHLGTPQLLVQISGATVWQGEYDVFGVIEIQNNQIEQPLRFAGQYHDLETGLYYNWNRYYSPELGRYVTSDPIGLYGGFNTFGYVYGNPLIFRDPSGLDGVIDDYIFRPIYKVTNGWSPEQSTVDAVAGFGNGVSFGATGMVNRALGHNINYCSSAYTKGNLGGMFFSGGGAIGKAAASGLFKHAKSGKSWWSAAKHWSAAGPRIRRAQGTPSGNELHHWAIQKKGPIGRYVPNAIKNHPWNLKSLPESIHTRMHGRDLVRGLPKFNIYNRWRHGVPSWAKAIQGNSAGASGSQAVNALTGGCGCGT